jgi:hypothetical protein
MASPDPPLGAEVVVVADDGSEVVDGVVEVMVEGSPPPGAAGASPTGAAPVAAPEPLVSPLPRVRLSEGGVQAASCF